VYGRIALLPVPLVARVNTQTIRPRPLHARRAAGRQQPWNLAGAALLFLAAALILEALHAATLERTMQEERRNAGRTHQALVRQASTADARNAELVEDLGAAEDEASRLYDVVQSMRALAEQLRGRVGLAEPAIDPLPELPPPLIRRAPVAAVAAGAAGDSGRESIVPAPAGPANLAAGAPEESTSLPAILPADTGPWPANASALISQPVARATTPRLVVASEGISHQWDLWQQLGQAVDSTLAQRSRAARPSGRPLSGVITSTFGRRAGFWGALAFHTGLDLSVRVGTPVAVTANGTVVFAGRLPDYGTTVQVQHADGLLTLYGHLSQALVRPGQSVTQGQIIALSGNTGISTGPHLHYEIRLNGTPVDPMRYW
jgi:murein DD-endopeptidase MepM/ murein hydrolase activator NlpD